MVALRLFEPQSQMPEHSEPFHEWAFPSGTVWTQFYRTADRYLLRFPGLADFTVSKTGRQVAAYPVLGVSRQTVDHLYLNQVLPLALSRQGRLILHGSAVELGDTAVAFLGGSGMGKSTLAASFATSGHRFLTDDGLQLQERGDRYFVQPSHPSIRLWDDSRLALINEGVQSAPPVDYTPKARLLADDVVAHCGVARPLICVYFLGAGDTESVQTEAVAGRDAMIQLVRNSFLLDIEEHEMMTHHFDQLATLAARPMFFQLDYPRQFDMLPSVCEAVISHATRVACGSAASRSSQSAAVTTS